MRSGFNRVVIRHSGVVEPIVNPLPANPRLMLNDGKCDRRGRYWCATVHSDFIGRQAELYRLDPDLVAHRIDGGFIIGNGIAFSPDDTRMYFADSRDETVWVYDFDLERGAVSNRRLFFSTADIEGRVDGATCDRDGNYWCALVHGGAVACIDPRVEEVAELDRRSGQASDHGVAFGDSWISTSSMSPAPRGCWRRRSARRGLTPASCSALTGSARAVFPSRVLQLLG